MSSSGGGIDDEDPGNQPDGPYYHLFPINPQPGLFGGQYAEMMANARGGMTDMDAALGMSPDVSTDGTGLSPSLVLPQMQYSLAGDNMSGEDTPSVDSSFISRQEGGQRATPYPLKPASEFPHSGVTVATGVDLGAHTARDLKRWGVSDATITALEPYLQRKGQAALDALNDPKNHPHPVIGQADLDAMDRGVLDDTVSQLRKNYDEATEAGAFDRLDPNIKTAIVDLAYQYGTNLADRTPKFWGDATGGDWNAAVNELNNFGDHFAQRRRSEAARLQKGLGS